MCNVISLDDRRNAKAKCQRDDDLLRLYNRLQWFMAADSRDKNLTKEMSRTRVALDAIMAQIEHEAGQEILRTRHRSFGFIDMAVSEFVKPAAALKISIRVAGNIHSVHSLRGSAA